APAPPPASPKHQHKTKGEKEVRGKKDGGRCALVRGYVAAALSSAVAAAIVAVREYWHVSEAWLSDNTRRGLRVKLEVRTEAGRIHGHCRTQRHTKRKHGGPKSALPGCVWARVSDGWPPEQRSQAHSIIRGPLGVLLAEASCGCSRVRGRVRGRVRRLWMKWMLGGPKAALPGGVRAQVSDGVGEIPVPPFSHVCVLRIENTVDRSRSLVFFPGRLATAASHDGLSAPSLGRDEMALLGFFEVSLVRVDGTFEEVVEGRTRLGEVGVNARAQGKMEDVRILAEQMRSAEVRAAVVQFTQEGALFKENNISKYLRCFEAAVCQWELTDFELVRYLRLSIHEDCHDRVAEATALCTWPEAKEVLWEVFRGQDETRMTVRRFAE
ncbi:MAG: hypothetical protein BJ554DRAFT_1753, partial [Olpidium bornovanus]